MWEVEIDSQLDLFPLRSRSCGCKCTDQVRISSVLPTPTLTATNTTKQTLRSNTQFLPMEVEDKAIQAASAPTTPDAPVRRQDSSSVTMSSSSPKTPESVTYVLDNSRLPCVDPHSPASMMSHTWPKAIYPSPCTARPWICCASFSHFATPVAMHRRLSPRIKISNMPLMRYRNWPTRKNPL